MSSMKNRHQRGLREFESGIERQDNEQVDSVNSKLVPFHRKTHTRSLTWMLRLNILNRFNDTNTHTHTNKHRRFYVYKQNRFQ